MAAVTDGLARTHPGEVADLLKPLLARTHPLPHPHQLAADFEILRVATYLGPQGYGVVVKVLDRHGQNASVQALGTQVALEADPKASIVVHAVRAVIGDGARVDDGWALSDLLDRLGAGLTLDNRKERVNSWRASFGSCSPTRPSPKPGVSRPSGPGPRSSTTSSSCWPITSSCSSCAAENSALPPSTYGGGSESSRGTSANGSPARSSPLPSTCRWRTRSPTSPAGCGAATATGDDRDLVTDILDSGTTREQLAGWRDELGTPSVRSAEQHSEEDHYPVDWVRVWRWTAVLPPWVYDRWQDAVD